jgi:hypothetical protein
VIGIGVPDLRACAEPSIDEMTNLCLDAAEE